MLWINEGGTTLRRPFIGRRFTFGGRSQYGGITTIPKEDRDYNNYDDIVVNKVKKLYDTILRTYHSSPDKNVIEMHIYLPQSQIKSS